MLGCGSILVVDPHPIFRRGLVECLAMLDGVHRVDGVGTAREAVPRAGTPWDLVLLDHAMADARLVLEAFAPTAARLVICSDGQDDDAVRTSLEAGAIGFLVKRSLRAETLHATLLAAADGNGIFAPGPLSALTAALPRPAAQAPAAAERADEPSPLTPREQSVLTLVADGEPTREIARRLCYSERTVKNVLHDVTLKLGARSRSHAIAHAVRQGFI